MPLSALAARRLETQRAQNLIKPISNEKVREDRPSSDKATTDATDDNGKPAHSSTRIRKRKRLNLEAQDGLEKTVTVQEGVTSESKGGRAMIADSEMVDRPSNPEKILNDTAAAVAALPTSYQSSKSGIDTESESYTSDDGLDASNENLTRTSLEVLPDMQLSTIPTSSLFTTSLDGRRAITATLAPGQTIVAVGIFDLIVRKGSVAVLGAIVHNGEGRHRIHALSTHSLPCIRALQHPKESRTTCSEVTLVDCNDGLQMLSQLSPAFVRLGAGDKASFEVLSETADDTLKRPLQALVEDSSWSVLVQKLITRFEDGVPRIAICGSKGSGKSSFARFLSNAMLSRQDAKGVAFLDVDPGQPEYSVPGHVYLGIVKAFNFGPAYTHPDTSLSPNVTIKSQCFGFLSPRDDPDHYLACISDLVATYRRDIPSYPLLVNFSGWTFGQGKETLGRVLRLVQPTDVMYMNTEQSDELSNQVGLLSAEEGFELHIITPSVPFTPQRSAPELRRMQTMSYFHLTDLRAAPPTWIDASLQLSSVQSWSFGGSEQLIDGLFYYRDSINSKLADKVAIGSVFSVVVVHGDGSIEQAFDKFRDQTDRTSDSETDLWKDVRASRSQTEFKTTNDDTLFTSLYEIKQTQSQLLHVDSLDGACRPLDPSKSKALGLVFVREIDSNSRDLRVTSPLSLTVLRMHKKNGARILLVHGQGYAADWAVLEPYHATSSRLTARMYVASEEHTAEEGSGTSETFNTLEWVERTARVQLIDKRDQDAKKRRQTWRLRRNLETSDANARR